ncbi:GPW/gp25 family protein [Nonomuraea sp. SYSU D8015]|uniref:GPW/gp25 family protein n=1 Tax=Nonomuraea sp. SYSU D8015 TaxID=2593644 RepID=UPI0016616399|nr:GPW/gp25 family protein [Nonomuraea sp. SYSU D8015]
MDLPFRIGADGGIATTHDPAKQIVQRIVTVVGTEPEERVMLPQFGVPVNDYIFEPGGGLVAVELTERTKAQMAMWEPGVIVNDVKPIPKADQQSIAVIDIRYTRTDAPDSPDGLARSIHTASIDSRGRLRERLRG